MNSPSPLQEQIRERFNYQPLTDQEGGKVSVTLSEIEDFITEKVEELKPYSLTHNAQLPKNDRQHVHARVSLWLQQSQA